VVIENYRPDVKDRLGIDYVSLKAINRRIILASISGFGQDGPYRDRPGFDQIAQGLCGIMSVTGFAGQGPMRAGAAVADVTAGLQAALGIMTAIVERESTGEGQWVQSNLLQAGLTLLDFQAARYTMDGQVPPQVGNDHPTSMPTSAYRTADGFINVAAAGSAIWKRLCDAIGRPDLMDDPRFKSAEGRAANRAALADEINAVLTTRPSLDWVESLNAAGVPCGPIHSMDEVFADAQVKHLNAAVAVEHPTLGRLNILNQAIKLSRTPAAVVTPTPERGEHSDEILGEIGLSAAEVADLRESGAIR
jgi:formyl-CoA transferase